MNNIRQFTAALVTLAALFGCSSEPKKPAEETKAAEAKPAFENQYITGREALQKMYIQARSWAPDPKPYSLFSQATKDAPGHDGKAGVWGAGFASATRRSVKVYTWSGVKSDDAPEPGVGAKPEDTYNPANPSTQVFELAFLKVDSDKALEVAQKHGGEKLLKKKPDLRVLYNLDWKARENKLYWHVTYGERDQPDLRVAVDATTGNFIRVEK